MLQRLSRGFGRAASLTAVVAIAACSKHATVTTETTSAPSAALGASGIAPTIYVAPFATDAAQVQVDPGGPLERLRSNEPLLPSGGPLGGLFDPHADKENPDQTSTQVSELEKRTAASLQADLVDALNQVGIHAVRAIQFDHGTPNSLLLTGQFVKIDQGQKTKRMAIGLGVGASYLETQGQLRDLARPEDRPLVVFTTSGDSGVKPGVLVAGPAGAAVTGAGAAGAAVAGAGAMKSGTPRDISHTATQIAAFLQKYYEKEGWSGARGAAAPDAQ